MKVFDASLMLEGVCYDAQRFLKEGNPQMAYKLLKNKLNEIDKLEKTDYARVRWN